MPSGPGPWPLFMALGRGLFRNLLPGHGLFWLGLCRLLLRRRSHLRGGPPRRLLHGWLFPGSRGTRSASPAAGGTGTAAGVGVAASAVRSTASGGTAGTANARPRRGGHSGSRRRTPEGAAAHPAAQARRAPPAFRPSTVFAAASFAGRTRRRHPLPVRAPRRTERPALRGTSPGLRVGIILWSDVPADLVFDLVDH